jgi:hypothetical protein
MCIKKLVSQTYLDIKKLVEENPNDGDLGKKIRTYFNESPNLIENVKEKLNFDDSHNNGY